MMRGAADWIVPSDHSAFAGHFPGAPIVPGVVLLDEAMSAVAAARGVDLAPGRIAAAKFLRPVGPGEQLRIAYAEEDSGAVSIEIFRGGDKVASARFVPQRQTDEPGP